jgi:hypothetical protein
MPTYEQTILQIMTRPAPRLSSVIPGIHPELDQLCADMMAHDPETRPRDMAAVRERLLRIFPEIEGGRMPMRSLTNEIGHDATISADASGQVQAQVAAALARAGLSGVGLAAPRTGGTQSALAVAPPGDEEPIDDVAGVPTRSSGALVGVVAVLALVAGIAGVAFVKMHGAAPPPTAGGFGLVQSTVSVPAATAPVAAPVAPPVPAATTALPTTAAAPVVAAPAQTSKPVAATPRAPVAAQPVKAPAAAPAAPAHPAATDTASRPVGGVGESEGF